MATAQPPRFTLANQAANIGHLSIRKFGMGEKVAFQSSAHIKSRYQKNRDKMKAPGTTGPYHTDDELDFIAADGTAIKCDQDDLVRA